MKITLFTREDLLALGQAIIRAETGIDYPFSPGTLHRAFLQVAAFHGAQASAQTIRLVSGISLEGLTDTLLDRRGLEEETERLRASPAKAQGVLVPITAPAAAAYTALAGTTIIRAATTTQSEIQFKLDGAAVIPIGGSQSNAVSITANIKGTSPNGILSGTQLKLKFPIAGVSHFLLTTDVGGGTDKQADSDYRTSIRDKRRSFAECSWAGIESLVKRIKLDTGSRVTVSKIFESFLTDYSLLVIDDGTGDSSLVGPVDSTTYAFGGASWYTYISDGNYPFIQLEDIYHLPGWVDGVTEQMEKWNGAAWAPILEGVDYFPNIDTGKIHFLVPLVAGDKVRAQFRFYTGLVALAAEYVNGIPGSQTKKGWRPAGSFVRVRGPSTVTKPSVTGDLFFDKNHDTRFGRDLAKTLILTYLNSIGIGDSAKYDVIQGIIHRVPGVTSVKNLLIAGGTSDVSPTTTDGVVRGDISTITV